MTDGTVSISPSSLNSGSATTAKNGGTTDDLTTTLMNDFNTFLNLLSPLASEAIIGSGVTALMAALDEAGAGLTNALGCFGTGLKILAPSMTQEAQSFVSLDSSLASTFKELNGLLPEVESYTTTVKLTTPTAAELANLGNYLNALQHGKKIQFQATTVPIQVQAPHQGGFLGWLHDNQWAAWTAVGVVTLAGIGLTLFTAGGSDVAAGAADTAILGTDAGVTIAADSTVATADAATTAAATTAATDVTLTTVGNTVVFQSAVDGTTVEFSAEEFAQLEQLKAALEAGANSPSLVPAGG
jgi:hypothetical protein